MPRKMQQLLSGAPPEQLSAGLHILLVLTVLTVAPAILVMTTSFTRIIIVLGFLRQALGTPSLPPNLVLIPLAGFLTVISMGTTLDKVYQAAVVPALAGKLQPLEAYALAAEPLREFMLRNTRQKDLLMLLKAAKLESPRTPADVPIRILVPAFALSELKTAFTMSFTLFLAFLAVDLIVASILMSLGMMMVPPMTISLPLKLLLFVMADGWNLVVRGLLASFG